MGDDLNRMLMEKVFNQQLNPKFRVDNFDIMGIGSCLGLCFYGQSNEERTIKLLGKRLISLFSGTGHIWGTGFIEEFPFQDMKLIRKNIQFDIVRGELTRRGVSKALGHDIDVPLADGGLLAPMLIQKTNIQKNGKVGIVPHYREKDDAAVSLLISSVGEQAQLIDVQKDTLDVITEIASCDYIISSSLHGLIVADAFGVPNSRIKITDNLLGTGFKFDDYYSSYGLEKKAVIIQRDKKIDMSEIMDQIQVPQNDVKQKQETLISVMERILKSIQH